MDTVLEKKLAIQERMKPATILPESDPPFDSSQLQVCHVYYHNIMAVMILNINCYYFFYYLLSLFLVEWDDHER